MPVWIEFEEKLARVPSTHPAKLRFLDRINYFGQAAELDAQGRVLDSLSAARRRDDDRRRRRARPVQLPRRLESRSLPHKTAARAVHRRRRAGAGGVRRSDDARASHDRRDPAVSAARTRRPLRRLHVGLGGHARALLEAGRDAADRPRSRSRRARARRAKRSRRGAIASSSSTPTTARSTTSSTRGRSPWSTARSPTSASRRCSSTRRAAASVSSATNRSTCAWIVRRVTPRPISSRAATERRARRHDLPLRRRAVLAAHRARDGRDAPRNAGRPPRRSSPRSCAALDSAARLHAHRSGDADLSSAPDLGQPRARRPRSLSRGGRARGCAPARGSPSSRFIRSRIGS